MADNPNPGNFANRPHEEVENIARKGGQSSHHSGFYSMDREKQVGKNRNIASKGVTLQGESSSLGRREPGKQAEREAMQPASIQRVQRNRVDDRAIIVFMLLS
ncbi:hypothetical protein N7491_009874 [Penicillium cf. griseofulvum]|nr:hypothetical protein N7491_009874 [Penicillium cf. griseofulvum]